MTTDREYYEQFLHTERGLAPPNLDTGPLLSAWRRWQAEGLDPGLTPYDYDAWCDAFGWDRWPANVALAPPSGKEPLFEEEILEETETTYTKRRADGSVFQDNKGEHKTIPHEIRPAITTRAEWERLRDHEDVDHRPLPGPDTEWAREAFEKARTWDAAVVLRAGSLLGTVRNRLGFEEFAVKQMLEPEWFEEMIEYACREAEWQVRAFGENRIPLSVVHYWEDICFKTGPIVSPRVFHEVVVPRYRRVSDLCAAYGYDRVSVDSDGNLWALIPGWVAGGVNMLCPFEVQAGMDVNEVRAKHPDLIMSGGVHKYRLAQGEAAIAAELRRLKPAVEQGRYIPCLDHGCPADVSLGNYLAYCRLKREILGVGRHPFDPARVLRQGRARVAPSSRGRGTATAV